MEMDRLRASLREEGQLQAILVRPRKNKYEIVAGERRWRAAGDEGWTEIRADVCEMDDREVAAAMMAENLGRSELTLMEEVDGISYMREEGFSEGEIAERLGHSGEWVQLRLDLGGLESSDRKKMRKNKVTVAVAEEILKVPTESRSEALQMVLGLASRTGDEVRAALFERYHRPIMERKAWEKAVEKWKRDHPQEADLVVVVPFGESGEYVRPWGDALGDYELAERVLGKAMVAREEDEGLTWGELSLAIRVPMYLVSVPKGGLKLVVDRAKVVEFETALFEADKETTLLIRKTSARFVDGVDEDKRPEGRWVKVWTKVEFSGVMDVFVDDDETIEHAVWVAVRSGLDDSWKLDVDDENGMEKVEVKLIEEMEDDA